MFGPPRGAPTVVEGRGERGKGTFRFPSHEGALPIRAWIFGAFGAIAGVLLVAYLLGPVPETTRCGQGFAALGPRCCPSGARLLGGECVGPTPTCPEPLVKTESGCDAPRVRVSIPAMEIVVGPSDWEAAGRLVPRPIVVAPFFIDAFEVTEGRYRGTPSRDPGRAVSGIPWDDARAFCQREGGRLPSDDEWMAAAMGPRLSRYPWGDSGAVCRRAAWGLAQGPCALGAAGPDTVGAHPDGASRWAGGAIHDLAGNVAEWVDVPRRAVEVRDSALAGEGADLAYATARGGSWASSLATHLRTWERWELDGKARDPRVGFRCAYDTEGGGRIHEVK